MFSFQEVATFVQDILFPVFCVSCEQEGVWLCQECFAAVQIVLQSCCPVCHTQTEYGRVCENCAGVSALDSHLALMPYVEEGTIGKLIHILKYQYAEDVMRVVRQIITTSITQHRFLFEKGDIIIPVPLHKKRYAERGFNQAAYIGRELSQLLDIPIEEHALLRHRYTPHQARLDREARLENVQDAFLVQQPSHVAGKSIVLVDDVFTTGSTMQSCAVALRQAGAREVHGVSVARG